MQPQVQNNRDYCSKRSVSDAHAFNSHRKTTLTTFLLAVLFFQACGYNAAQETTSFADEVVLARGESKVSNASALIGAAQANTLQFYSAFEDSPGHCEDATLRNDNLAQTNFAQQGYFAVDGDEFEWKWSDASDVNSLIRFPSAFGNAPGQVPQGAVIQKAELVLFALDPGGNVDVYMVEENWDEDTVNWFQRGSGMGAWSAAGAKFPSSSAKSIGLIDEFPSYSDIPAYDWVRVDITKAVQAWADAPASNFGLMLDMKSADGNHFVACEGPLDGYLDYSGMAHENFLRPGMVVTYAVPDKDLPSPNLLWEKLGEEHGDREPVAIASDASNVFVAGIERHANGETQWVYRHHISKYAGKVKYEESALIPGTPTSIATDPSRVYVGGCRISAAGDCDAYIRAYNKSGSVAWATPPQKAPFGLAGGYDSVNAMSAYNGNLFVAATTTTKNGDTDYLVLKINAKTGDVLDLDQYGTSAGNGAALGIQAYKNRVVSVGSTMIWGETEAFVKTYAAASFNTAWTAHLDLAGGYDEFSSVLVSSTTVVAAGTGTGIDGDTDVIAMAYRLSDGASKWTAPMVRDHNGGNDELVAATWYQGYGQRFMLASNMDHDLNVPGYVVSGHYAVSGNDAWAHEQVRFGSVETPYALAGGRYRTFVAAAALGAGGTSGYLVGSYTANNGKAYWQDPVHDAFYAKVVTATKYTEKTVYAAGCRINNDGKCSIMVRAVKGTK